MQGWATDNDKLLEEDEEEEDEELLLLLAALPADIERKAMTRNFGGL